MSDSIIENLRRAYEARNRGRFDEAAAIAHPEIEFYPPGEQPPYRGIASFRAWMEPDAFEEQVIEPLEFTASGSKVLVRQRIRFRGAGSGIEMEIDSFSVWTFDDDGLAIRLEGYQEHEEAAARQAAGL